MRHLLVVCLLAACGGAPPSKPATIATGAPPTPPPKPLEVRFGACDEVGTTWTSGGNPAREDIYGQAARSGATGAAADDGFGDVGDAGGGYGLGAGGTGTGSGDLGTIGHGNGGKPAVPTVSIGTANAEGDLDKAVIRRYIKRNTQKIQYCYEKNLLADPNISGTVIAKFTIEPGGNVSSATTAQDKPMKQVGACVAGVVKQIAFPKPKSNKQVVVTYPFVFRQSGDAGPPATRPAPPQDPKPAAPRMTPKPVFDDREHSPLRAKQSEIVACLRSSGEDWGAVVVQLGDVKVFGAKGAEQCLVDVAKTLTAAPAEMCGFAYGAKPLDKLIVYSIGADGKLPKPMGYVGNPADVVRVMEPAIVRVAGAASVKQLTESLGLVAAAEDFVLAAQNTDGTWRTLNRLPVFPVEPVAGDRKKWAPFKRATGPDQAVDADAVILSVRVTRDRYIVGISRVNEVFEVKRDGDAAAKLRDTLKDRKLSAFFADRVDAEVAADDDLTFADLVVALDALDSVGFTSWRITPAAELSAPSK